MRIVPSPRRPIVQSNKRDVAGPGEGHEAAPIVPLHKIVRDCGGIARQEQSPPRSIRAPIKIAEQRQSLSPPFHWGRCIPLRAPWRVALAFRCVGSSRTQRLGLTAFRGWASGPFPPGSIHSIARGPGVAAAEPSRQSHRATAGAAH